MSLKFIVSVILILLFGVPWMLSGGHFTLFDKELYVNYTYTAMVAEQDLQHAEPAVIRVVEHGDIPARDKITLGVRSSGVLEIYRMYQMPNGTMVPDVTFNRLEEKCDTLIPPWCSFDFVQSKDPNYPSSIYITDMWLYRR